MNKRTITLLKITILLSSTLLYSEDNYDDLFSEVSEMSVASEPNSPLSISGTSEFIYDIPYNSSEYLTSPNFKNTFTVKFETDDIDIFSKWEIDSLTQSLTHEENYIKLKAEKFNLTAGYKIFSWGFADNLNPTDYLNPREFMAPTEIEKIPSLSLNLDYYFTEKMSLETVFLPIKKASVLFVDSDEVEAKILLSSPIAVVNFVEDELNIKSFVFGNKLNYYGISDISISYIYDFDRYFMSETELSVTGTPPQLTSVDIKVYKQRIHRVGLSFKTTKDIFGLWLDTNFSITEDFKDYLEWTVGTDFAFGSEEQGLLNLQTFGTWVVDYDESEVINNMLQNFSDELSLGGTLSINYGFLNDEIKPEIKAVYLSSISDYGSLIIKPSIKYTPIDSLEINFSISYHETWNDNLFVKNQSEKDSFTLSICYTW